MNPTKKKLLEQNEEAHARRKEALREVERLEGVIADNADRRERFRLEDDVRLLNRRNEALELAVTELKTRLASVTDPPLRLSDILRGIADALDDTDARQDYGPPVDMPKWRVVK